MDNPRLSNLIAALGKDAVQKIQDARVLVIGAGGIGCELLKNLVLAGFQDIEVVDLDTIDVSNLNRQFLFRKKNVGQSKSLIAKESVLRFNPAVKMTAHHGNVKDGDKFNVAFVKKFTVVANALDNVGARRHVNCLCVKAGVPLVESGSTGYLGQSTVHYGGVCECYDCQPKATPKKFPICTIRSTPTLPVHTIQWAKELFKLLFGAQEDSMLSEDNDEEDEEDESTTSTTTTSTSTTSTTTTNSSESVTEEAAKRPTKFDADTLRSYAMGVLRAFFMAEINKKLEMRTYETAEHTPTPVDFDAMNDLSFVNVDSLMGSGGSVLQEKIVWTLEQNTAVFVRCVMNFWNEENRGAIGVYEFDKDNRDSLDFVVASNNLRAHVFHIPLQSTYGVKQIAGNIVHAIATTNAMAAGLEVIELMKIVTIDPPNMADEEFQQLTDEKKHEYETMKTLKEEEIFQRCRYTAIMSEPTRKGMVLLPMLLDPPNTKCAICSGAGAVVTLDCTKTTLATFLTTVVKGKLGINKPEFDVGNDVNRVWMFPDDYDDDGGADVFGHVMINQLPGSGGISDGSKLKISDEVQGRDIAVLIQHMDENEFDKEKHPECLIVKFAAKKKEGAGDEASSGEGGGKGENDDGIETIGDDDDDDDDCVMIVDNPEVSSSSNGEKKRSEDSMTNEGQPAKKKCRVEK